MLWHAQSQAGVSCEVDCTRVVNKIFLVVCIMRRILTQNWVHGDMVPSAVAQRLDQRDAAAFTQLRLVHHALQGALAHILLSCHICFAVKTGTQKIVQHIGR